MEVRDYLALLELDPELRDWPTVDARIREQQRAWSVQRLQGTPSQRRKADSGLKQVAAMRAALEAACANPGAPPLPHAPLPPPTGPTMSTRVYGIDLGTTYSCIARIDEFGKAEILSNAEGQQTTPSVVYFEGPDSCAVGESALQELALHPDRVVVTVKRAMGDPNWRFLVDAVEYSPQEVSARILQKLAADAEAVTGEKVTDVVITVPAYFGQAQREATRQAGEIAGLSVRFILPEPTAAALFYGMQAQRDQTLMVYDLGGGTFDITLMRVQQGKIDVLLTDGNHQLGGKDWDDRVANHLAHEFSAATGVPAAALLEDNSHYQNLMLAAEKVKKGLSNKKSAKEMIRYEAHSAMVELGLERFNELTADLLEQTLSYTRALLERAREKGLPTVETLLLVGGSSYMPQVKEALSKLGIAETRLFEANLAVGKGAALLGQAYQVDDALWDEIARILNKDVEEVRDAPVPANVRVAATQRVAGTFGLAGNVVDRLSKTEINLISPKNFGIKLWSAAAKKEVCVLLVLRDDKVPVTLERTYGTVEDGQTSVKLELYENDEYVERDAVAELDNCQLLSEATELVLDRPMPAGSPIEVSFSISEDGQLAVTGREPSSGRSIEARVRVEGLLDKSELAKARQRASAMSVMS